MKQPKPLFGPPPGRPSSLYPHGLRQHYIIFLYNIELIGMLLSTWISHLALDPSQ
jgi:hypothetical protein